MPMTILNPTSAKVASSDSDADAWFVDSSCTLHVCSNRNWFCSYEDVSGYPIGLPDGSRHEVIGIGSVMIRMFDGTLSPLTEVHHVPGFITNLISIGALHDAGYEFGGGGGLLWVKRGAATVLKGHMIEGRSRMYRLSGTTVIGGDASMCHHVIDNDCCEEMERAKDGGSRSWIVSTTCATHVCSRRRWFYTYKESSGDSVRLADGSKHEIIGIGSVKIKMFDGKVRLLMNVKHVPGIKENIISVGTLDDAGHEFEGRGGFLTVKRKETVILEGQLTRSCSYRLVGGTVTGDASISPAVKRGVGWPWTAKGLKDAVVRMCKGKIKDLQEIPIS